MYGDLLRAVNERELMPAIVEDNAGKPRFCTNRPRSQRGAWSIALFSQWGEKWD